MWIEHIGTIMAVVFVVLILAHVGLHFYFKSVKRKQQKRKKAKETPSSKQ